MPRSDSQLFLEKGRTHRVGSACLEQLGHAPRIGLSQQNQNRHRFEGTQRVRGVIVEGCVVCHDERPRCGIGSCEARRVIHADVPRTQRIAEPPGEVAVKVQAATRPGRCTCPPDTTTSATSPRSSKLIVPI